MGGRVVVETTAALVALLAAFLVVGRYRSSSRVRDLALVQAFVVLAVFNLLPNVVPALVAGDRAAELRLRLALVCTLLAGASFAFAAVVGDVRYRRRRVSPAAVVVLGVGSPVVGVLLLGQLGVGAEDVLVARLVYGAAGLLSALAALGFEARAHDAADPLRRYLALGCVLAATSRLLLVVDPASFDGRGLHPADVFRLLFYGVLLFGAAAEIRSYWQRIAVLDERRRLARDLHDGVAQELSFIVTEAARRHPRPDQLARISVSARRALDESRGAIHALSRPLDQPLEEAVAEVASEVALRAGTSLRLDLARGVVAPHEQREQLVRILREALTNAITHGRSSQIQVELREEFGAITLRVIDDGVGFVDTLAAPVGHFGLATMRERATHLGAELELRSQPGRGTTVEVRLPCPA